MQQLVANGRGIGVLPDWIVWQDGVELPVPSVRLGSDRGLEKCIHVGFRRTDEDVAYLTGFLTLADETRRPGHS